MKKIISIVLALFVFSSFAVFAEVIEDSKNIITVEATAGVVGLGTNEVATYDFMITPKIGIGVGVEAAQGVVNDVGGFIDLKITKWNFGFGAGYNAYFKSPAIIMRAVYEGTVWELKNADIGLTFGSDWHVPYGSEINPEDAIWFLWNAIPRFIIGMNCKFGF